MLNDILIIDQQWLPNQSDFPPMSWHWYRAWPSPIMSGFHGAFATGVACQQGTLILPDTWFRPPLWDLLVLQFLRPDSSNLPCLTRLFTSNTPWYFLDFAYIHCSWPCSSHCVIHTYFCLENYSLITEKYMIRRKHKLLQISNCKTIILCNTRPRKLFCTRWKSVHRNTSITLRFLIWYRIRSKFANGPLFILTFKICSVLCFLWSLIILHVFLWFIKRDCLVHFS